MPAEAGTYRHADACIWASRSQKLPAADQHAADRLSIASTAGPPAQLSLTLRERCWVHQ
jgi:hypothetical protein